jgi:hypothetical protein
MDWVLGLLLTWHEMETASILLDHNDFPIKRKMNERIGTLGKGLPQREMQSWVTTTQIRLDFDYSTQLTKGQMIAKETCDVDELGVLLSKFEVFQVNLLAVHVRNPGAAECI